MRCFLPIALALVACTSEPAEPADPTPGLTIDVPAAGAWVPSGAMQVRGSAAHLSDVSLDGEPIEIFVNRFDEEVRAGRGIRTLEARGVDERGDELFVRQSVIAGRFGSPAGAVDRAVKVRVSDAGVDQLIGLIDNLLDLQGILDALPENNPVIEDSLSFFDYSVDLTSVSMELPAIAVTLEDGRILATVVVDDIDIQLDVFGSISGIGLNTSASATVERASTDLTIEIGTAGGGLRVELAPVDLDLTGFAFDASLIPGSFEDQIPILSDAVRDFVVDTMELQINALAPALISELVAGFDPSFETEVLDRTVGIEAAFAAVAIAPDGIEVTMDLEVDITGEEIEAGYAGTFLAPGGPHELPEGAPFAISLHDDLLNRILFEIWQSGLLNLTLSTEDGSLDAELLGQLEASTGTVRLDARLPPVAVDNEGQLEIQLGELGIAFATPGGGFGDNLDLAASGGASLTPQVSGGSMGVSIGEPVVSLMVRGSDWNASDLAITNLLEDQLPLEPLLTLASLYRFQLPSFVGVGLGDATVGRSSSGVHTTIAFDLVEVGP